MAGSRGVKRTGGAARGGRRGGAKPASRPADPRPAREDLVRALVLETYARVRGEGKVADRTLAALLRRERRLYAVERRAVSERVYGMLRLESRITRLLERGLGERLAALSETARYALIHAAYRVLEQRISPANALTEGGLSPGLLPGLEACRSHADAPDDASTPEDRLAMEGSLPAWLAALFLQELGETSAAALLRALNARAPLTVRANALRIDRDGLRARLAAEGIAAAPTAFAPMGLIAERRVNLFSLPSFREGLFEIQDEGSQLLACLLDPRPGWLTVDACAGAGGKTLALATHMKNRGRLIALDTEPRRLDELPARAQRAGVHNWEAHLVPADGLPPALVEKLEGRADAVLIDAPCSGLGVLRRNPDARFRLTPEQLASFSLLQQTLLARYARLVKPGGRLVYATCSLARQENEEIVEAFLQTHPDYERIPPSTTLGAPLAARLGAERYLKLLPHEHGTDGFFGALLVRRRASATP